MKLITIERAEYYTYFKTSPKGNTFEFETIKCTRSELDTMCQKMAEELKYRYGGGKVIAQMGKDILEQGRNVITYLNTID